MIPSAKLAQKRAKLRAKKEGTPVTLTWTEWPNGKPTTDPTSGASLVGDNTDLAPESKTATVKCFVHFITPVATDRRVFSEVEQGDAIVDFPLSLYRVTAVGDSAFALNQVVDELTFNSGNRDLETPATGELVTPHSLENLSLTFGGHTWAQKTIGAELSEVWDTLYSGINITRAMLVTKR